MHTISNAPRAKPRAVSKKNEFSVYINFFIEQKNVNSQFMAIKTPWGPVGYLTYKRTYSREIEGAGRSEEFHETINRVIEACCSQLKVGFTQEEENTFRSHLLGLKSSVAGRFWWQLGTKTVDRLGLFSLQNCAFSVVDDPIEPFCWAFDALMLGSGVGFNIQRKYVYKLPKPKQITLTRQDTADADFIVPDSREGWVALLRKLLEAHFVTGKGFSYSTMVVRGKGAPIKSFGGIASGPEDLCNGMALINDIINKRFGKQLRPIDCLDVMNIIGMIVVSGNVRRSAQIAIGDMDDIQFLKAKRWDLGNIPNWRAMSNNSVVCSNTNELPPDFWAGYEGKGEPYGIINLKLARKVGRLGDENYPDHGVLGANPCVEQFLDDKETCALAEVFLPNIVSKEELIQVVTYLYRVVKHSLALPCHTKETEAIVHKNMRMGIGITGYLQATEEQKSWLSSVYEALRAFDEAYSKAHGWPRSIKLTTCKPSGTLSLLAGVTPGIHPGYAQYFIRRIRVAANSPLVQVCRDHGCPMEYQKNFDGTNNHNTMVVSFPCNYPEGTVLAGHLSAIDQLEWVVRLQREWSDNGVSVTVYYKLEELPAIKKWLGDNFGQNMKAVSFLLHSEHGFAQAPYEEISKEQFEELKRVVRPIEAIFSIKESELDSGSDCETGACPVK